MTCSCGGELAVLETRKRSDNSLRRRRKCLVCGAGMMTVEQIVHSEAGSRGGSKRPGNAHIYLTTKDERKAIRAALKVLARLSAQPEESL